MPSTWHTNYYSNHPSPTFLKLNVKLNFSFDLSPLSHCTKQAEGDKYT